MEITVLSVVVGILAILQGWQMVGAYRKRNNNPTSESLVGITGRLDVISSQLGRMEQRLNDVWEKIKE